MSTIDLAANTWNRVGSTTAGAAMWASVKAFSPQDGFSPQESPSQSVDDFETAPELEPPPYDPDPRVLTDDVWHDWFGIWR